MAGAELSDREEQEHFRLLRLWSAGLIATQAEFAPSSSCVALFGTAGRFELLDLTAAPKR